MENFREKYQAWLEGMKNTYRLVVMNDETFEEVGSYRLTRLNVYILASSILVILVIFVTLAIAFTPLKEYIPGYGDAQAISKSRNLEKKLSEAEKQLEATELYIKTIKKVLTGNIEPQEEEIIPEEDLSLDSMDYDVDPIPEDYALRTEIERDEMQSLGNIGSAVVSSNDNSLEQLYFVKPVKGAVVSDDYHAEKEHYGIDLVGSTNSPILSTLGGVVILSDYTFETGYVIAVQHSNNLISFYKHNSKLLKKVGDKVNAGEAIAIIGNTGELSEGPHLHFELWYNSKPVDPRAFIPF